MTPLYSQNGELIYPSDSEDSVQATSTSNTDNRAVTPHSVNSTSPPPQKIAKPSTPTQAQEYSPRYSPNLPHQENQLDNSRAADHGTTTHLDVMSSSQRHHDMTQSHVNSLSQGNNLAASLPLGSYKNSTSHATSLASDLGGYSVPNTSNFLMSPVYMPQSLQNLNSQSRY